MTEKKNTTTKTGTGSRTRAETAIDEAANVVARFAVPDTLAPVHAISLDALARTKAEQHPRLDHTDAADVALVMNAIQGVIKERAVDALTRLDFGRVVLDLEGHHGRDAWRATDCPSVVFCALTSQDSLAQHGRAMAVYFDPSLVGTLPVIDRSTGAQRVESDGSPMVKPNAYDAAGYVAIVGFFPTVADAESARDELRRAVEVIAAPDPDDATDAESVEVPAPGAILTAL